MSYTLSFQDRSGSYKMERLNNVVLCTVRGAMGVSMAKRCLADLTHFAQQFGGQPWGFVANALDHQGAVQGAEEHLTEAYLIATQHNCKSDAYCLTSAMSIAQLDKIRRQCSLEGTMSEHVFSTKEEALTFVKKELSEIVVPLISNNLQ